MPPRRSALAPVALVLAALLACRKSSPKGSAPSASAPTQTPNPKPAPLPVRVEMPSKPLSFTIDGKAFNVQSQLAYSRGGAGVAVRLSSRAVTCADLKGNKKLNDPHLTLWLGVDPRSTKERVAWHVSRVVGDLVNKDDVETHIDLTHFGFGRVQGSRVVAAAATARRRSFVLT